MVSSSPTQSKGDNTTELYPPVNYKIYKPLLDMDQAFRRDAPGNEDKEAVVDGRMLTVGAAAAMTGAASAAASAAAHGTFEDFPGASLLLS